MYYEDMIDLLPSSYDKRVDSNIGKIFRIIGDNIELIDEQSEKFIESRHLTTAGGVHLDRLAKIFNVTRDYGESDDDFRARLYGIIAQIHSCGTIEDIIANISYITGVEPEYIEIIENLESYTVPNFTCYINKAFVNNVSLPTFISQINEFKAVGVRFLDTEMIITMPPLTIIESTPDESVSVTFECGAELTWGACAWGEESWGNPTVYCSTSPGTITPLTP